MTQQGQDRELEILVQKETTRQKTTLTMIASENYVFPEVYKYTGSFLTNKYSEGRVGARYYGGTKHIDEIESLCQKRALALFGLDESTWGVSVQPYSGSTANLSAYAAMTIPGGKIMGMDLPSGGHLTHGFQTTKKKISASSLFFSSFPYRVNEKGLLDYNALENQFNEVKPDILICGYSAHSQDIDYKRLREIVKDKAFIHSDISHISALISAGLMNNPFTYSDVVMTTTHKGLRGPRGALIFYRKLVTIEGKEYDMDQRINSCVFPLLQGGPHNHTIAGIAHALEMASREEFKVYAQKVIDNAQVLVKFFSDKSYKILTETTKNHMLLIDLTNKGVKGADVEIVCDALGISINKNSVPGDTSPFHPSGIRIGTYAVTTRGFTSEAVEFLGVVIDYAVKFIQVYQEKNPPVSLKEWLQLPKIFGDSEFTQMKYHITTLAKKHPIPE